MRIVPSFNNPRRKCYSCVKKLYDDVDTGNNNNNNNNNNRDEG